MNAKWTAITVIGIFAAWAVLMCVVVLVAPDSAW